METKTAIHPASLASLERPSDHKSVGGAAFGRALFAGAHFWPKNGGRHGPRWGTPPLGSLGGPPPRPGGRAAPPRWAPLGRPPPPAAVAVFGGAAFWRAFLEGVCDLGALALLGARAFW